MNVPFPDPPPLGDSFRAKVDRRVVARRRNHRLAAASVAGAVLVVAVATALTFGAADKQSVHTVDHPHVPTTPAVVSVVTTTTVPGSTTSTSAAPTTTVADTTPTTLIAGTPILFSPVSLVVPTGWSTETVLGMPDPTRERCIGPDDTRGLLDVDGCHGLVLFRLSTAGGSPRANSGSTPDEVQWADQTGMDCPFRDAAKTAGAATTTTSIPHVPGTSPGLASTGTRVASGYRPVGDRTAAWATFDVSCTVGAVHHIQVWILPASKIGFETVSTDPEIEAILSSVRHNP